MKKLLLINFFFSYFGIFAQIDAPIIAISPPTCGGNGSATITNANFNYIYTFSPAGPVFSATGQISGLVCGLVYTVTATDGNEVSPPSTPFSVGCALVIPDAPIVTTTAASCAANGTATITNYNASFTYTFTPAGPSVNGSGVVVDFVCGTTYTVQVSNGDCQALNTTNFIVGCQTDTSPTPIVNVVGATCKVGGLPRIINFDPNCTYTFTPAGPQVVSGGWIQNYANLVNYTVTATCGGCPSLPSAPFSNGPLPIPADVTFVVTPPTCEANGSAVISPFFNNLTYVFIPAGPTVSATGQIENFSFGVTYSVYATNSFCQSENETTVTILQQLTIPVVPTVTVIAPTCFDNGIATITNHTTGIGLFYDFTPNTGGISVNDVTGEIFGIQPNVIYTIVGNNGSCTSTSPSNEFSVLPQLPVPSVPNFNVINATCDANGQVFITNYNASLTYTFAPAGPVINTATSEILGATLDLTYTLTVTNAQGCSAFNSFTVAAQLEVPAPVLEDGFICVDENGVLIPGGEFILNAGLSDQSLTYQWFLNGNLITGLPPYSATYTATEIGIYTVIVDNGACIGQATAEVTTNCNRATLRAFIDHNNNGVFDADDTNFSLGQFTYEKNNTGNLINGYAPDGIFYLSDNDPANTYQINYEVFSDYAPYYNVTTSSYSNVSINGSSIYYFPIVPNTTAIDLTVHIIPHQAPRAGFTYANTIRFQNAGPFVVPNGTITFTKDPVITINNTMPVSNITATGFTYDFENLQPFEIRYVTVNMMTPPLPTVQINQPITHTVNIAPTTNDVNLVNNTFSLTQHVVAAYDPNDKMEAHGERIVFADYNPDEEFTYTIRFENEGNIYAINVRVTDELDAKIDETSVRMVAASHDYQLERNGNLLTWRFNNINLPVSVPGTMIGHGFITFSVKMKPGIQLGDTVPNQASIYFDTNPPIITNEFVTLFYDPLSTNDFQNQVAIYPNPSNDWVNIQSQAMIIGYTLVDLHGKTLMETLHIQDTQTRLSLQDLSTGIYFLKIKTNHGDSLHKLVKR